ncbi:hypothetical protein ACWD4N_43380, partial [Streptomyces sp. NPDC002586]
MTPPAATRKPTAREQQYLRQASRAEDGRLPEEVSRRLVESMLDADWIYGEDPDGYRLSVADALGSGGAACWKITSSGRWTALTRAQRRALTVLADGGGQAGAAGFTTVAVQVLVDAGLAVEGVAGLP